MGDHDTWYTVLMPDFWARLEGHAADGNFGLKETLGREWQWQMFQETHFTLLHVMSALIAVVFLIFVAFLYRSSTNDESKGLVPPRKWTLAAMMNNFIGAVFNFSSDIMGEERAARYLPIIGTLALFIFCCNIQALIPGFLPATDTLKTNVGIAFFVFVVYNIEGLRHNGMHHLEHFLGPKFPVAGINFPWLFPLMLPVEIVSHFARPLSLALRLMGNMFADHKVLAIMMSLIPLFLPVPFLLLGVLVCIVQTTVFSILTMIYIGTATDHVEDH